MYPPASNALNAACIQLSSGNDMEGNIRAAEVLVREAAGAEAQLVLLPENAFFMDAPGVKPRIYAEAEHPGIRAARGWARELGIFLLIGSAMVAADGEEARALNRSLLIDAQGEVAARYDKIHLFDVDLPGGESYRESSRCAPGGRAVVAQTPWGALGMTVCYDVRFPQLYRTLAQGGAFMLAVPSAFTRPTGEAHWEVLLRARAIENGCFVLAPAQCGIHPGGRGTHGHSLIIDPWGKVLAEGGDAPGIIHAALDLQEVEAVRARLPSLRHDRAFSLPEPPPPGN